MILYDVFYPGRSCDLSVPWSYLEKLARDRKAPTARAESVNTPVRQILILRDGRWEDSRANLR
jgi:hypothetical protein